MSSVGKLKYYCSLPHRQLRKNGRNDTAEDMRSLPHRQLRKLQVLVVLLPLRSLPHRQLRKHG
tara:strand:+ start:2656 stop:2844 length:189 start_codon:yes stop_codon:yes gene_type:complete